MNFYTPKGLSLDTHKSLMHLMKCTCGSNKLRPMTFVLGENNNAFFYECLDCYEKNPFVYSKKKFSTNDSIIFIANDIEDLNKHIKESSPEICDKCKKGTILSVDSTKCNRMALDILECNECHFTIPVISVVRDTLFAYSHDMQLGKKVAKEFPEIALVFCVSALETYFRQIFQYRSEINDYLVKNRRVNFQNLAETKEILKREFKINIDKLIEKDWSFLSDKFRLRHRIIHHASFDKDGKKIEFTEKDIDKLFIVADDLVYKVEMELFNKKIVI